MVVRQLAALKPWSRIRRPERENNPSKEDDQEDKREDDNYEEGAHQLCERHSVTARWIKGHAKHPENTRCDELAEAAARKRNLAPDAGYEAQLKAQAPQIKLAL